MNLYAIFRRPLCSPDELEAVDQRSRVELDKRADQVRKIRSFVLEEDDGAVGTICFYEAVSPQAVRAHAKAADLPVHDIVKVNAIDVERPDPVRVST